jgi:uncharacterized protein (DUF362 family)
MTVAIDPATRAAAPVALRRTAPDPARIAEDVLAVLEAAEWTRFVGDGADVSLKPNLGWDKPLPGAISAPWVVEGVILALRERAGSIVMVESDQVVMRSEDALRASGLDRVCARHGIRFVNMSHGSFVRVTDASRHVLRDVMIPEVLTRTQLVTLPVLKTHNKTTITGALKNQWGCLDTLRHEFHLVLSEALADVNSLVQPRLAVMDGTVGLEGDGPKAGIPREMGLVLASANLVGLDAVAARVMGYDPDQVNHLSWCADAGLGGVSGFEIRGESVDDVAERFRDAHHNAVSWLELALRTSALRRLVFHTPVFHLMCWGARRYYDVWNLTVGRRRRQRFLGTSAYAAQWRR